MTFKSLLAASTAVSAATLFLTLPAQAQATSESEARLAPVTVTAQRVEEDLQDVPVSITVVDGAKLNNLKAGGADVRFLSARVPSVVAESSFGRAFPRFYIRGIGNTDFDLNASQPVSLVYDGVPYESPILKGFPVFDLENIEVLRGPQGTLFGRNTPGGIIKFDSAKPVHEFDAYARAAYGNYNTVTADGAVNLPIFEDQLALRVSGLYQDREPYVDNGFTGQKDRYEGFEEVAGRAQLLFTPLNTDFEALLNVHARTNDGDARLFRANIIQQGNKGLGPNFDRDTVFYDGQNFLSQDTHGVTLTLSKGLTDSIEAVYVFGNEHATIASRGDIDGGYGAVFLGAGNFGPGNIPFPVETSGAVDALHQTTHELRFAFDDGGPLRAQTGVFFFDEQVSITSKNFDSFTPGNPETSRASRALDTESVGIFASLSYDLTDTVTVSGGARWTDDEKEFRATGDNRSLGDEQVSWDASISWQATENVNTYAKVAKGFRGPTIQQRFGAPSQADSETLISYEAGVKTELMEDRVRLNTAVYFLEFEGQQLTIVGGLDNSVSLFNADKSEGYGFEVDLEAAPVENLLVTGGLSYNKTEFKDDLIIAPGCGAPCTILDPAVFDNMNNLLGYNISGNSFPNAPEWIANVTARYAIPFGDGEFYGFTDWAYKSEVNFFLYDSVEFGQEGYWEGGLRLGYEAASGWGVSVFARNILDEEALEGAIDFNNLTGFVNEPRTYGIEVNWQY